MSPRRRRCGERRHPSSRAIVASTSPRERPTHVRWPAARSGVPRAIARSVSSVASRVAAARAVGHRDERGASVASRSTTDHSCCSASGCAAGRTRRNRRLTHRRRPAALPSWARSSHRRTVSRSPAGLSGGRASARSRPPVRRSAAQARISLLGDPEVAMAVALAQELELRGGRSRRPAAALRGAAGARRRDRPAGIVEQVEHVMHHRDVEARGLERRPVQDRPGAPRRVKGGPRRDSRGRAAASRG